MPIICPLSCKEDCRVATFIATIKFKQQGIKGIGETMKRGRLQCGAKEIGSQNC
jgi:hypothetical protein